jgi:hypothetical protein
MALLVVYHPFTNVAYRQFTTAGHCRHPDGKFVLQNNVGKKDSKLWPVAKIGKDSVIWFISVKYGEQLAKVSRHVTQYVVDVLVCVFGVGCCCLHDYIAGE